MAIELHDEIFALFFSNETRDNQYDRGKEKQENQSDMFGDHANWKYRECLREILFAPLIAFIGKHAWEFEQLVSPHYFAEREREISGWKVKFDYECGDNWI